MIVVIYFKISNMVDKTNRIILCIPINYYNIMLAVINLEVNNDVFTGDRYE